MPAFAYTMRKLCCVIPNKKLRRSFREFFLDNRHNNLVGKEFMPPKQTYKELVCITGFGHSGSGTLIDLFSEFENCTVLGYHDTGSSGFENNKNSANEFDFLRLAGGVFELEHIISRNNVFVKDVALKQFLTLSEHHYLYFGSTFNDEYLRLTYEFIEQLIEFKIPTPSGAEYHYHLNFNSRVNDANSKLTQPFLKKYPTEKYIYHLKKMSKEEYIKIARSYIDSILNTIESKPHLVLDQIFSDAEANTENKLQYIPNAKIISVYRDPRDVYATGILSNIHWIPSNVEYFIKWYKSNTVYCLKSEHPNHLKLRFEDVVLDYEKTCQRIFEFTNIKAVEHKQKNEFFIPEKSSKNIALHKKLGDSADIRKIEEELQEFCYN